MRERKVKKLTNNENKQKRIKRIENHRNLVDRLENSHKTKCQRTGIYKWSQKMVIHTEDSNYLLLSVPEKDITTNKGGKYFEHKMEKNFLEIKQQSF